MQPKRPSHVESVELQRLQALVETQRKHIEELNAQLHELLVGALSWSTAVPALQHGLCLQPMLQHIMTRAYFAAGGKEAAATAACTAVTCTKEC